MAVEHLRVDCVVKRIARCVHIDDRGSDIYELYCAAQNAGTHLCVHLSEPLAGTTSVAEYMEVVPVKRLHRIELRDDKGTVSEADSELKYQRLKARPQGKQARYSRPFLTVMQAVEQNKPVESRSRETIDGSTDKLARTSH